MPRPQLAIGDYGTISYSVTPDGSHVAMARFRDVDGETRRVRAQGSSKSGAAAALKAKFKERVKLGDSGDITNESTVRDLAERYWLAKQDEKLAANTYYNMRRTLDNHVIPLMGKVRLREATAQRIGRVVSELTRSHGPHVAGTVRFTLSGMFALAAQWGALQANPVANVPVPKVERKPIRVLTVPELWAMREYAVEALRPRTLEERYERAGGDRKRVGGKSRNGHLLDIMDFLLATGCRAGEAPGLAWEDVHLDDEIPWVKIHRQVTQVVGHGIQVTPTKEKDERFLRLPAFAVEMLRRRRAVAVGPMVFPNERGGLLGPRNLALAWKTTFAGSEWEWVTQKVLRKTVATLVSEEHGSALAAKQLGHASDTVTRAHYIARSLAPVDVGTALEQLHQPEAG